MNQTVVDATIDELDMADAEEVALSDIYKQLIKHEDIIIIIDRISEAMVRKGLSNIKSREAAKLRDNDIEPDATVLKFIVHDAPDLPAEQLKLQIVLEKKSSIKLHKLIIPTGEL